MIEMFQYAFMQRALIVGLCVAICAALVGVSLVLRKNSMIGDGLSHTAFSAFALATVLGLAPLYVALPVVIIASFFVLRLSQSKKVHGDAAIAVLSASSLAIGTFAISVSKGVNIDLNSYLFGSILSASWADVVMSIVLAVIVVSLYLFAYHRIFAITFDEEFAKSVGVKTSIYDAIFAAICSCTVVLGMRLLGSLLISSLIIFPTLTAMRLAKNFKGVVFASVLISIVAFLIGLALSYMLATPTGATVVLVNLAAFILSLLLEKTRKS
ncbi:metal ABC transporter permease [Candidatus Saccharibacteria bacterium]|nr:metal ABC transporter permease [Candidatus Saccharibacteria bacterium]MBR6961619.1 metal ABC transporter permease [Candidatus Saccharibacteria bacterium]